MSYSLKIEKKFLIILFLVMLVMASIVMLAVYNRYKGCNNAFNDFTKDEICKNCQLKIPKIIHRIWMNFREDSPGLTQEWLEFDQVMQKNQPDWRFIYWDEKTGRDFIAEYYPEFLKTYDNYDVKIKKADALRYFLLDHFGGIYLDYGFYSIKNFEDLLKGADIVLSEEPHLCHSVTNGFMASIPGHAFIKFMIGHLAIYKDYHVLKATGPLFVTILLNNYLYLHRDISIKILPMRYIFPLHKKNCEEHPKKYITEDAFLVKCWKRSWTMFYNE